MTTTHLENHPQAFLDANGIVVNVAIFNDHDEQLIARCVELDQLGETSVDCCRFGEAVIGWSWNGKKFVAPVAEPIPDTPAE
jgi:hypothetical protein